MKIPVQEREISPRRRVTLLLVLGVVVSAIATVGSYEWANRHFAARVIEMGGTPGPDSGPLENFGRVWTAWGRQRAAAGDAQAIPTLRFDIRRRNIGKLAQKRDQALRDGILEQGPDDYVGADITVSNGDRRKKVRARIRLKGDFLDHIKGDKWSFRVRVSGDGQVLGMRVFSIQHPKVRGYAHECLVLEHMRREGVLAPRYEFVRVVVNGNQKGIMALEEHFSKELLESQQRRESVIVRFDETLKWRTIKMMDTHTIDFGAPYPLITPFQGGKVSSTPNLARDLDSAVGLLRGLISKTLRPSEVFDAEVMARFLAVAEVWGAHHTLFWNNIRFYFNPITGLLEPIAFDCNLQDIAFIHLPTALVSVDRTADDITADCLEDPRIRQPFLRDLRRICSEYAKTATWERERARELELHDILHQEFPLVPDIQFGYYRMRAERLLQVDDDNFRTLPLMPPNYPVLLHAFVQPSADGFALELFNLVPYTVDVTAIAFDPPSVTMTGKLPLALPPTRGKGAPAPTRLALNSPEDVTRVTALVTANIRGYPIHENTRKTHTSKVYSPTATTPILPDTSWEEIAERHPYVERDGADAKLGPGNILIRRPLILPRGTRLTVAPGTRLRFGTRAFLLARGPVQMQGTAEKPIDIGPAQVDWPGIAVIDAGAKSLWSHVQLHGTRGLAFGRWVPTGSVMFYQSPVRLTDCTFTDNKAEDMLNLIRSEVSLENVTVERCTSDAIDMDFCKGSMTGGLVRDIGGDGVDVSGTTLTMSGTRFEQIEDKALSSGERSRMKIDDVHIADSGTGLASKDDSEVTISNSNFREIRFFAVIAFMKKPEYGFGRVTASNLKIEGPGVRFKAQTGSSVVVDGQKIPPVDFDVDALYRDGPMNKSGGAANGK